MNKPIQIKNETLLLSPKRALYWEKHQALILSDLHLGKTSHLRKHGIAIPQGSFEKDIAQLQALIHEFSPLRLIIVGDLFHNKANSETTLFLNFIKEYNLEVDLIMGNHEQYHPKSLLSEFNLHDSLQLDNFLFVHNLNDIPGADTNNYFAIAGHIHPVIMLNKVKLARVKLPCFAISNSHLVLPAFGSTTGGSKIKKERYEKVIGIVEHSLIDV